MKKNKPSGILRLASLMRPHAGKLLICLFCVLCVNLAELLKPLVAAVVIDDFLKGSKAQQGIWSITGMGVSYLLIVLFSSAFSVTETRLIARVSQAILHKMRLLVFDKILHMPMETMDSYGTGRLITRATNDVETVNEFYSDVFLNLFKDVTLLVGIVVVMVLLNPVLAAAACTGIPLIILLVFCLKKVIRRNFQRMKRIIGQINGFFAENVAGMRIVQAFNRQREKMAEFRVLNKAYYKAARVQILLNSILRPSMEVINSLVIAVLVLVGYRLLGGKSGLEVGVLYAFTNYAKQFFEPINDLAEKYTTVQSALVSTERIYEILDDPRTEDPAAGEKDGPVFGEIEFRDVWFAYNEGEWVLKGVSFRIERGQRAAFVGATGAGKTTIISLIARYYNAQKGQILIDGVPIENWALHDLRRGVVTVLQDVFLFTGDVRENIDMHAGVSDDEIDAALETACASDFVEELGGMHAPVTEQGLNLSTGQRQLLSFARAVAAKPAILVLDEATAHVDTVTEATLRQAIETISRGRTCVYIAHRLSTIRDCDVIFVMDHGEICETGDHRSLVERGGMYAELVRAETEI